MRHSQQHKQCEMFSFIIVLWDTHIYVYLYLYDLSLDDTEGNCRCNTDINIFYSIWLWIQNNKLQNRIDAHKNAAARDTE